MKSINKSLLARNSRFFFLVCLSLIVLGCFDEDYFGYSPYGNIKAIEVSNQAAQASIDASNNAVSIEFPEGVDLTNIVIKQLTLSSFAKADVSIGEVVNFSNSLTIVVTAEDGSTTEWTLNAAVASLTPQLAQSDFNTWYQTNDGYYEPGSDAESTIWGTGNPGTKILNIITVNPVEIADQDLIASMETKYNGDLPASFGTPISAASIFTGKFDKDKLDINDPSAAIDFGTPFAGRPKSFSIAYTYVPGSENKDRDGNPIATPDECDIYLLLEYRAGDKTRRLGTAWFRSSEVKSEFTALEVPITYGPLDASFPDYMKPEDGKYIGSDSASYILPTHLTFVATSSYGGNVFSGAVGSKLQINNLELRYE